MPRRRVPLATLLYEPENDRKYTTRFGCISRTSQMVMVIEISTAVILLDFSLTVKAATLIFIFGRGSAVSSAKEGESGFIYNLVKS